MNQLKQLQALRHVREYAFDKHQRELMRLKERHQRCEVKLHEVERALEMLDIPTNGTFQVFKAHETYCQQYRFELRRLRQQLTQSAKDIEKQSSILLQAHKEVEKVKYLESDLLKTMLAMHQKKEQQQLDEVSMMLFNRSV